MGDELIDLQTTLLPVLHKSRKLGSTFDAAKCAALPYAASNELERSC